MRGFVNPKASTEGLNRIFIRPFMQSLKGATPNPFFIQWLGDQDSNLD